MAARVLLTGATSGTGYALLKRFAGRGDILAADSRSKKEASELLPAGTPYCRTDPGDPEKTAAIALAALDRLGWDALDLAVLSSAPGPAAEPERETTAEIRATFDAGMFAGTLMARALFPRLEKTGGKLVLVAGTAHDDAGTSQSASTAGLRGLGRALAAEWHGRIAVQTIYFRTTRKSRFELDDETSAALIEDAMRAGQAETGLSYSRFLASRRAWRGRRP